MGVVRVLTEGYLCDHLYMTSLLPKERDLALLYLRMETIYNWLPMSLAFALKYPYLLGHGCSV